MNDNFLILTNIKKTILRLEKFLENYNRGEKVLKENIQKEPEMEIVVLEKDINIKENDKTTKITSIKHRMKPKQNGLYDKKKNQVSIPVKIKRAIKGGNL